MARQLMTIEQNLSILRSTAGRIGDLTSGLTDAQLHASPEPGEWSVTEIVAHLRACADVWGDAIEAIATIEHPTIRAVSPVTWIKSTDYRELRFASSWQAFIRQREGLLVLLGRLPQQGWARSATVLGGGRPLELTIHSYVNRMARHERTHWRHVAKTVRALLD
jgi:hypothetical protein